MREQTGRDILDSLADHLRDRHILLVLDNSEQVVEAASAIARLLDAAPALTVLATSRLPFHVSGEQEYQVPPLAVADPTSDPDIVSQSEAVALFVGASRGHSSGLPHHEPERSCGGGDHSPARRPATRHRTRRQPIECPRPETMLGHLDQRLSLLTGGPSDLPQRQRTLRSTIEWSHDLLGTQVQRLFGRLTTFNGGWTLEAAEAVCGPDLDIEILDGLGTLIDHSMVQRTGLDNEPAVHHAGDHSGIRRRAARASGEEADLRRRHAEYFRDLAEEAELHLTREDRVVWLARVEEEHDNLRAVLDWCRAHRRCRHRPPHRRGHLAFLAAAGTPLGGAGPAGAPPLDAGGGHSWRRFGPARWRPSAASPIGKTTIRPHGPPMRRLSRSPERSETRGFWLALLDLSYIPYLEQDPDRSEAILREGLARAEEAGDRVLTAEFLSSIGFLEVVRGNPAGALEPFRTAIEMLRQEGAAWQLGQYLSGQAMINRMVGELAAAKRDLHEALEMFAQARDSMSISMALTGLALVANDDGHHERAGRLVGAAARIRDQIGGGIPPELAGRWGDPEEDARQALGEDDYRRARAEGYAMPSEQAVAYALKDHD